MKDVGGQRVECGEESDRERERGRERGVAEDRQGDKMVSNLGEMKTCP